MLSELHLEVYFIVVVPIGQQHSSILLPYTLMRSHLCG